MFAALLTLFNLPAVNSLIERLIPDPAERYKITEALLAQVQAADAGQIEVNKEEAQSSSVFVAGARPFLLWVCAVGLAWQFILSPFLAWTLIVLHSPYPLPQIQSDQLYALVTGMLGLGGYRMMEKIKGVAR